MFAAVALLVACSDAGSDGGQTTTGPSTVQDVSEALREKAPVVRARRLVEAFERLPPEKAEEVLDAYFEAVLLVDAADVVLFAGWWATHDPAAAFEAFANTQLGGTTVGAQAVIRVWMQSHHTAALLAVEDVETNADRKEEFIRAVVRGWYESGRAGVWDYVQTLNAGFNRQRLVANLLMRKLRDEGVEETITFVSGVPEDDRRFRRNLFHRAAGVVARKDLERAVEWADELIDDDAGASLGRIVGGVWVQRGDPGAAMKWLIERPQGQWGHVAVRECYRIWVGDDREAALAWMEGQERNALTEPALAVYAVALSRTDGKKAVATLEDIGDNARREKTTIRVARRWHKWEPEAADAWVDTLPPSLATEIRSGQPVKPESLME